jgi:predicted MFS family arabinose efflux permease
MGLLQQTSNLGQFAGPLTTGLVIAHFGWPAAPIALIPAAAIGVAVVFWVRRRMVAVRGGPN